jgi:hypothetical protein
MYQKPSKSSAFVVLCCISQYFVRREGFTVSLFRLSNHIFELGLDAQEMSVYAYLCSLPATAKTLTGASVISVRQTVIGQNCGIKSPVTISKTIERLREKGLVDYLERQYKANGHRGTYCYEVTKQKTDTGFFTVDRRVFGMLTPRQMLVYLFLCNPALYIFILLLDICLSARSYIRTEKIVYKRHFLVLPNFRAAVRIQNQSELNCQTAMYSTLFSMLFLARIV